VVGGSSAHCVCSGDDTIDIERAVHRILGRLENYHDHWDGEEAGYGPLNSASDSPDFIKSVRGVMALIPRAKTTMVLQFVA